MTPRRKINTENVIEQNIMSFFFILTEKYYMSRNINNTTLFYYYKNIFLNKPFWL